MALDKFQPYLFVSAGEQSNKYLTPTYTDGIAQFQAQRTQSLTGLTVRIDPIQAGTGDPSPTNIRPISGRTGLTVTRAGKNLCSGLHQGIINADGSYTAVTSRVTNAISAECGTPVKAGTYTISSPDLDFCTALTKNANGTVAQSWAGAWNALPFTFTVNADSMLFFSCRKSDNSNLDPTAVFAQLESGSTATPSAPYAATYPVTWETEAGEVYGGTLDVVSGVLTANRFFKAFDGTENWARTGSTGANTNRYYIQWVNMGITGNVINLSDSICSHLVFLSGNVGQFGTFNASTTNFAVKDGDGTQFADMAAFKAWLAAQNTNGTPLQLCVELAESTTYQITPTDIKTLAGFNQIYSDAGPVIDIKF